MAMALEKVVPFGRSLDEYRRMFSLNEGDLNRNIIGIADGPASFNAEMTALGRSVLSVDPLYTFPAEEIERQFHAVVDHIVAQLKATPDDWVWSYHRSPDHLKQNRLRTLQCFLSDYPSGTRAGRYRIGELPSLDFPDRAFQLALCSHFLFLYSDHFPYEFHRASIREMLRIADEVRVFPLMTLALQPSPYLAPVIEDLAAQGFQATVESVDYELQKGGNQMLRIRRPA